MIYILYRMMGIWYSDTIQDWHKLTDWLDAYENDIDDIYISSNIFDISKKYKEVSEK